MTIEIYGALADRCDFYILAIRGTSARALIHVNFQPENVSFHAENISSEAESVNILALGLRVSIFSFWYIKRYIHRHDQKLTCDKCVMFI